MVTVTRVVSAIVGSFFLLISVGLLLGGAGLMVGMSAFSDDDGYFTTPEYRIENSDVVGVISQSFSMDDEENHWTEERSDHTDRVHMHSDFDLSNVVKFKIEAPGSFVAIGSTNEVLDYLSGHSYLTVSEFEHMEMITSLHTPLEPVNTSLVALEDQPFWIASGEDVLIYSPQADDFGKDLTIVVLNINGTTGLDTTLSLGAEVPILKGVAVGLFVGGIVLLIISVGCFVVAIMAKEKPKHITYLPNTNTSAQTHSSVVSKNYCAQCGAKADPDSLFCSSCGQKI